MEPIPGRPRTPLHTPAAHLLNIIPADNCFTLKITKALDSNEATQSSANDDHYTTRVHSQSFAKHDRKKNKASPRIKDVFN